MEILKLADDIFKMIQPVIGPAVGGALALVGGAVQAKRTDKATKATERRKLSHDSAREVTSLLAIATGIGRRHHDHSAFDLTKAGRDELADCVSTMEHHSRYISDKQLQDAVVEAVSFLRPPPHFEEHLGKSVPVIIWNVQRWIGPMVQAHVLGETMPKEPDFLKGYRSTYKEVESNWEDLIAWQEKKEAEEREAKQAQRKADEDTMEAAEA